MDWTVFGVVLLGMFAMYLVTSVVMYVRHIEPHLPWRYYLLDEPHHGTHYVRPEEYNKQVLRCFWPGIRIVSWVGIVFPREYRYELLRDVSGYLFSNAVGQNSPLTHNWQLLLMHVVACAGLCLLYPPDWPALVVWLVVIALYGVAVWKSSETPLPRGVVRLTMVIGVLVVIGGFLYRDASGLNWHWVFPGWIIMMVSAFDDGYAGTIIQSTRGGRKR